MPEIASKSIYNWQLYPSSKCYESDKNLWFGIWRSAVAPSDSAEKNGNIGPQLQSIRCTKASKMFHKICFLYDFWALKLVHSEPFLDYLYELRHLLSALDSDMLEKILYSCTYTFSAINNFCGIFFKSLSYLSEVVRTNFCADFLDFRNVWPQFRENCGVT